MCDLWLSACTQSFSIKEYCQKFQSSSSIYQQAINKNNKLDVIQSPMQRRYTRDDAQQEINFEY
jgi:hypothetical protein